MDVLNPNSTSWETWAFGLMALYLIFIFLRTAFHLFLCFANSYFVRKLPDAKSFPLVTVIIPAYNEEKVIEKATRSVLDLTYPNLEVLIVDDGSKDSTFDEARNLEGKTRVRVIHQKNAGKAAALNRGISEAQGEYFICMDADSYLNPTVIQDGLRHFEKHPNLAAVAGAVEIGNVNNALTAFQRLEYVSGLNLFKAAQSYLGIVTVIPGPIGLFKKSCVQKVGGYDGRTYAEDCELTLRLLLAGYQTVYEPAMVAVTEAPEDLTSLIKQRYRWSRGVTQAIHLHSRWGSSHYNNLRSTFILIYMVAESVFIPLVNFIFAFFAINFVMFRPYATLAGEYFLDLMLLDLLLALFCVLMEGGTVKMLFYAFFNRLTYGLGIETLRFFSVIEEAMGIPMTWGKLVRKGLVR